MEAIYHNRLVAYRYADVMIGRLWSLYMCAAMQAWKIFSLSFAYRNCNKTCLRNVKKRIHHHHHNNHNNILLIKPLYRSHYNQLLAFSIYKRTYGEVSVVCKCCVCKSICRVIISHRYRQDINIVVAFYYSFHFTFQVWNSLRLCMCHRQALNAFCYNWFIRKYCINNIKCNYL